jgi:hypothetical protein
MADKIGEGFIIWDNDREPVFFARLRVPFAMQLL